MFSGQSHQLLGCYEEALAHYDIAISKFAGYSAVHYNRGLANASLQRFHQAKEDFENAIEY